MVVKPDGSVLVHQRAGREPVNWQPPGTRVRYQTETDNGTPFFVIFVQDGDPIMQPDPGASIPEPSVVYDDIYATAKTNGHEYDWWTVT